MMSIMLAFKLVLFTRSFKVFLADIKAGLAGSRFIVVIVLFI